MLGRPQCRALWDFLADFCFRSSHTARVPPVQSTLEHSQLHWPYLYSPGQDTSCIENPGTLWLTPNPASAQDHNWPSATVALAVLPGHPMHRVPQDLLAYTVPQLQPPLQGTFCKESPGTPQFTCTSASAILSRCPLCIEPWVFLACTHFSFSCPARAPFAQRAQAPPGPHQPAPAALPGHVLYIELRDALACTHFSLSHLPGCPLCGKLWDSQPTPPTALASQ